ncbi:MAG: glycosyltransferase family 4 protein [Armatimonadota bacterium]
MSNHTIELMKLLRKWGHRSEIYVVDCDPRVAQYCCHYTSYQDSDEDVLMYQYGTSSELTRFLIPRLHRTILSYHNVTPAHFFASVEPEIATILQKARDDLYTLAGHVKAVITDSEYNRCDLQTMGFRDITVLPPLFDLSALQRSAESRYGRRIVQRYCDGYLNILFVGRLAPNKCQDDLIRALVYYKRVIDARARLILVGGSPSLRYRVHLEMIAKHLGVEEDVHFVEQVRMERGFGGYYKAASVFLCLSEHEGFCIPLIESMYCDLPVIAYASSAIPETLGGCGILVTEKRYDVIGELMYNLANDQELRQELLLSQHLRAETFRKEVVEAQFRSWIARLE